MNGRSTSDATAILFKLLCASKCERRIDLYMGVIEFYTNNYPLGSVGTETLYVGWPGCILKNDEVKQQVFVSAPSNKARLN